MSNSTAKTNGSPFFSIDPRDIAQEESSSEKQAVGEDVRRHLRQVLTGEGDPAENIRALLRLGADRLDVENAHLVEVNPAEGTHTIKVESGGHPEIEEGSTVDLSGTYCRKLVAGRDAMVVRHAPEQGWDGDLAYEGYGLATYIGAKMILDEELYGTVCFVSSEPREEPFDKAEEEFLELLIGVLRQELRRHFREARFRRTRARMKVLFEGSPDMISVWDLNGTLLDANPRLLEQTGYAEAELADMHVWALHRRLDPEEVRERWTAMEPGSRHKWEGRCQRKDGSTVPVEVHLRRLDLEGEDRFLLISRDITEHREREQELRRQNDLFEQAQSMADIGAWEYDVRADRLTWTDQVYEMYDLPETIALSPEKTIEFFHPEDQPVLREAFDRAVEEGVPYDEELRLVTARGNERWVKVHGEPRTEDGEVVWVRGTIQDITGRKRRVRQLRSAKAEAERNEELFHSVMENAPLMIDIIDQEGRIEAVSTHFEEVLGWTQDDLDGQEASRLWELFYPDPDRRELAREYVQEAPDELHDFRPRAITGERVDSGWTSIELPDGRRLGVGIDIRDQKRRERELEKTNATLEAVLDNLPAGVLTESASREVLLANERLCELFQTETSPEDLKGRNCRGIAADISGRFSDPERFERRIEEIRRRGEPVRREELRMDNGRVLERDFVPYEVPGGEAALWVYRDVTARKRREEELRTARDEAEEAARFKSAMLANMSHEVRTPLTAINGFAEILREEVEGTLQDLAQRIHRGGKRLMKTLDSVLQLSKLEAGELDLKREPVRLGELVEETADLLGPKAEEEGLSLETGRPEAPVEAWADEGAVAGIAENLVENAIKFTSGGGQVTIRAREADGEALLEVEDTGVGIGAEARPEIFQSFKQESGGLDREYEGSGLGLSIVDRLVDLLDGTIEVDSEKGEGSRFVVRFPGKT